MQSKLNPYINFNGNAKEALEFYTAVFGGKLTMSTFQEGGAPVGPADADKIMHGMLVADNGILLMASDTPPSMPYTPGTNISISLSGDNDEELREYWNRLLEGGTISVPLDMAPWGDVFGMVTDKFGIGWLVNITAKK